MKKKCNKCNIEKDITLFNKKKNAKDGLNYSCKECVKQYSKTYYEDNKENYKNYYIENKNDIKENIKKYKINNKEYYKNYLEKYYLDNKEDILDYKKKYYLDNKEDILDYKKIYYDDNKEQILEKTKKWRLSNVKRNLNNLKEWRSNNPEYLKEWRSNNPEKIKEYYNNLRLNKPHLIAWRTLLRNAINRIGSEKENSTFEMLGYTASDLKIYIESLFSVGMSWDNWGEWHLDHKYPLSKFDKDVSISVVNSLSNLQPLWAFDNLSKGNKIKE